ncbi:restriction endonuclease subunit S [Enterococcus sp. C22]|uniref:restriction endonuclease subunit S n=1 Tax=Enterococcus sp. C22 TaxID=3231289 RepID=UPI0034A0330B
MIVFTLIGVWEHRKVEELGDTFTGLTGKTKEDFGHGDATFVTYINVFNNPITDLKMTESVEIDTKQNQVEYGDIFFTTSSETPEEVGMSSVWLGNEANVYLNSFCFGYRPVTELAPYYMAFMLRSPNVRKKFMFLAQGISRYNISKNRVMDIEIPVPNIDEQRKVGQFFKDIDDLITLHQRKLDQLKKLKKAYLHAMFVSMNTKKNKVPKLRFTDFEGDWELCKLEEIVDVRSGRDYKHLGSGNIPVYGTGGYMLSVSEALSYDEDAIGIGRKGTINNPYILKAPFWTVDTLFYTVPKNNFDLNFIYSIFRKINWKSKDESTGVPSLSKKTINAVTVYIPSGSEQQRIGEFFKQIDNTITLHQNKLEQLNELKKSYLQNMFI